MERRKLLMVIESENSVVVWEPGAFELNKKHMRGERTAEGGCDEGSIVMDIQRKALRNASGENNVKML